MDQAIDKETEKSQKHILIRVKKKKKAAKQTPTPKKKPTQRT
jgi:hypothetical protein